MRLFTSLYDKVLQWSAHPKASWLLGGLSFAESSFFPIPPDVMLAPMAMARRDRAWFYAALTTIASVLGGLLGYMIGAYAFDQVTPYIQQGGYWPAYLKARDWFDQWGVWVVFVAGFSPIPYKVFTISAGVASMALLPFVLASAIGRGARFFLVAGFIYWGGEKMERYLHTHVERLGWLMVALLVIAFLIVWL